MFLNRLIVACTVLMIASCASSGLAVSWKAPGAQPLHVKGSKVGAVVMIKDEELRRIAEDTLAREIGARGAEGVPAYTVVQESQRGSESDVRAAFDRAGVQGIIVMRPITTGNQLIVTPAMQFQARYGSYWGGYYGYGWRNPWSYPVSDTANVRGGGVVTIETLVYSLRQNRLVWAGRSQTVNAPEIRTLVRKLSADVAKDLERQGLLAR